MNIVLLEPEIPDNTGNIGRTCVATGSALHLIKPLGFEITEKAVRRAGLDYWGNLQLHIYENFEEFLEKNNHPRVIMATTKAKRAYTDIAYRSGDFILFGKESRGIPEELLVRSPADCVRIPMSEGTRSLNLSNAVAVVLYEALRQTGFRNLETKGELHHLRWGNEREVEK